MSSYDVTLRITTEILGRHVSAEREIKPTDHIQNDLGLDSLGVMEVVADVEDRFNVSIPSDALERMATVEDVARTLDRLRV
jgi:acyl carrier protein